MGGDREERETEHVLSYRAGDETAEIGSAGAEAEVCFHIQSTCYQQQIAVSRNTEEEKFRGDSWKFKFEA